MPSHCRALDTDDGGRAAPDVCPDEQVPWVVWPLCSAACVFIPVCRRPCSACCTSLQQCSGTRNSKQWFKGMHAIGLCVLRRTVSAPPTPEPVLLNLRAGARHAHVPERAATEQ